MVTASSGVVHESCDRRDDTLSLDEFIEIIAGDLWVAHEGLGAATRFREDLGLDAFQMLKLALRLDSLGTPLGAEDLSHVRRMDDAYRRYLDRRARASVSELLRGRLPNPEPDIRIAHEPRRSPLISHRTRQRLLTADDDPWVRALLTAESLASPWRPRAAGANPETFTASLWDRVLTQHLVVESVGGAPIAVLTAYGADFETGTARVAATLDRSVRGEGWPLEAMALFVNHLFRMWPLRKLYAEVLPHVAESFASGIGGIVREEGCLVAHAFVAGSWSDVHVLSLFRSGWETEAPRILKRIVASRSSLD
jgi:RimJ/RimL family protein N-acetyltransferase